MKSRKIVSTIAIIVLGLFTFSSIPAFALELGQSNSSEGGSTSIANTIIDNEGVLNQEQKESLSGKIIGIFEKNDLVVSLITTNDMLGLEGVDYAKKMGNDLGVGDSKKNNGIVVALSMNDRKVGIAYGRGIDQNVLSSRFAKDLIDYNMIPELRIGNAYGAFVEALDGIYAKYNDANTPSSNSETISNGKFMAISLGIIAIIAIVVVAINLYNSNRKEKRKFQHDRALSLLVDDPSFLNKPSEFSRTSYIKEKYPKVTITSSEIVDVFVKIYNIDRFQLRDTESINTMLKRLEEKYPVEYYFKHLKNKNLSEYKNLKGKDLRIDYIKNQIHDTYGKDVSENVLNRIEKKLNNISLGSSLLPLFDDDTIRKSSINDLRKTYFEAKQHIDSLSKHQIRNMDEQSFSDARYSSIYPGTLLWMYLLNNRQDYYDRMDYQTNSYDDYNSYSAASFNSSSFGGGSFSGGGASGSW